MDRNTVLKVKNRSAGGVVYSIPEMNLRREFAPGEEKRLSYEELERLSYISGGQQLINDYLQIINGEVIDNLNIPAQPEYFMDEKDVKDLLINGTMDELLDCLDYAPAGVITLIKDLAVKLPLADISKQAAIKEKIGFDCGAAIRHIEEEKVAENQDKETANTQISSLTTRRTSGNKYKRIQ